MRNKMVYCAIAALALAVLGTCENQWMKDVTRPLYEDEEDRGWGGGGGVPVLTGTVSITGAPEAGQTLTADTSLLEGSGTINYQWGLGGALSGPFTDIAAATASTYTVQTADTGRYIVVTVTRDSYSGSVSSDPGLGPVGLPLLTGTVTASGTAEAGQVLTANTAALGGSGTISYQWQWGTASAGPFTDIAGAAASSYTVQTADAGQYIVVMVTRADNSGFAVSGALGPVPLPILTGTVTVTGAAEAGQTLTANTAALGGSGTISYQWRWSAASNGTYADIASATAAAYTLTAADHGRYITVRVTRAGYSGYVVSSPTGPSLPAYMMVPVPTGTVAVGMDWGSSANYPLGTGLTISAFSIGETEITYELWDAVRTWAEGHGYTFANPGRQGGDFYAGPVGTNQHPVTTISWRDAVVWCNAYSEAMGKTPVYYLTGTSDFTDTTKVLRESEDDATPAGSGKAEQAVRNLTANGFRLPTEAEWEYAARGGYPSTTTPWTYSYAGSNTVDDVAWYDGNSGDSTHPVKTRQPNSLGLYDMSGNVDEMCQDIYSGNSRVERNTNWAFGGSRCEVVYRSYGTSSYPHGGKGFRVVCRP